MDFRLQWRTFTSISSAVVAEIPKFASEAFEIVWGQQKTLITAVTGLAIVIAPIIVVGPLLSFLGFSAGGVVAGSIAAAIQSSIGHVATGSLFAIFQSAAMGGAGMLIVGGMIQIIAGVIAVAAVINLFKKILDSGIRNTQIRGIEALDVGNLSRRLKVAEEVELFLPDQDSIAAPINDSVE